MGVAEHKIGQRFPATLERYNIQPPSQHLVIHVCCWLCFHSSLGIVDGQTPDVPQGGGLLYGCRLLRTVEIVDEKARFFSDSSNDHYWPLTNVSGILRFVMDGRSGEIYTIEGSSITKRADTWLQFLRMAFPNSFPQ